MLSNLKKLSLVGLMAFSAVFSANRAHALPSIVGDISIGAFGNVNIDFNLNTVTFTSNTANALIVGTSGDYTTVIPGIAFADYKNFSYSPLVVVGSNPVWQTNTPGLASFALTGISFISESPGIGLVLKGSGTASLLGFADTGGSWSFSADSSNGGAKFSWASTTTAVPDNGITAIMMGFALVGIAVAARAKKKA